jgi:cytidine deaminase
MCRELISDYGPDMNVILPGNDGENISCHVSELLPLKYKRS